jgi:uncharacterized protein
MANHPSARVPEVRFGWPMRIEGTHQIDVPRRELWSAIHDPRVLADAVPGLRELEAEGPDRYAMTIEFGVGSVRGVYQGRFSLTDEREGELCTLKAEAGGAPGTVDAVAEIRLDERDGDGTTLSYVVDANVVGPVAGVGGRLIAATAKRTSERFVEGLQREIAAPTPGAAAPAPATVFAPSRREAAHGSSTRAFTTGAVLGFALAMAGVAVGRWTARPR